LSVEQPDSRVRRLVREIGRVLLTVVLGLLVLLSMLAVFALLVRLFIG